MFENKTSSPGTRNPLGMPIAVIDSRDLALDASTITTCMISSNEETLINEICILRLLPPQILWISLM